MVSLLSWKIYQYFFEPRTPSASMLTCRRHTVDTPQTMTLTMVQTFDEQEGSIRPFPERYLEKAKIVPLFCIFRNWYFYR